GPADPPHPRRQRRPHGPAAAARAGPAGRLRRPGRADTGGQWHGDWDDDRWRKRITESFGSVDAAGDRVTEVVRTARYLRADVTRPEDLRQLLDVCNGPV